MKRKMIMMMLATALALQSGAASADELLIRDELESNAEIVSELKEGSSVISGEEEVLDEGAWKEDLNESPESIGELNPDEKFSKLPENGTDTETIESVEVLEEGVYTSEPAAAGGIPINVKRFPDEAFRTYIKNQGIDKNNDGMLSSGERKKVTSLTVSEGITDLKGIEYFTSLIYLNCSNNRLSSLDVSRNLSLKELSCSDNHLSSLDISGNVFLESLSCGNNQLSSLNVSQNTALKSLSCFSNQLSSLNVSQNTVLEAVICSENHLSSLDVSGNPSLEVLWCDYNRLSSLDIGGNPLLKSLSCIGNQLGDLDVSRNPSLEMLHCSSNQLSGLDVSGNPFLETLGCFDNQLRGLDVSGNPSLKILWCSDNQLSSLDISQNIILDSLVSTGNTCYTAAPVLVNGVWQLNLAAVLGNADLGRVVLKTEGAFLSGEMVIFTGSEIPKSLEYTYDTMGPDLSESNRLMNITLKWDIPQEAPEGGTTGSEGGTANSDTPIRKSSQIISVDKTITKIYKRNGTFNLNARAKGKLTYKTGNAKIATVSSNGKVKMKKCGTVVITIKAAATTEYKAASVKVKLTIKDKKKQTISVNRTITKTYSRGEMFSLGAKAKGKLTYKSSNTKVAVVSALGTVKITGYGTTDITVKAAATAEYKAAAATVQLTVGPGAVQFISVTSEKKGYLNFKWMRNIRVSGYEISYSANKEFDSPKTGTAENSLTKGSNSGLVSGQVYYARIRGYRLVDGGKKIYGPWSAVKSCKVK